MPDSKGRLTQDDFNKVKLWFDEKTEGRLSNCPMCKATQWATIDLLGEIRISTKDFVIGPGVKALPVLSLLCKKCGYMAFFNAAYIGIVGPTLVEEEIGHDK